MSTLIHTHTRTPRISILQIPIFTMQSQKPKQNMKMTWLKKKTTKEKFFSPEIQICTAWIHSKLSEGENNARKSTQTSMHQKHFINIGINIIIVVVADFIMICLTFDLYDFNVMLSMCVQNISHGFQKKKKENEMNWTPLFGGKMEIIIYIYLF